MKTLSLSIVLALSCAALIVSTCTVAAPPPASGLELAAANASGLDLQATNIDRDGDGYGVGPGLKGPDADDGDASVQTADHARAKYPGGSRASDGLSVFWRHRGYTPAHYYYLSPSGDDRNGKADDPSRPFATFEGLKAARRLTGDDAVIVRAGTYSEGPALAWPNPSGSQGHPILFLAYPGEAPVIDSIHDAGGGDPTAGNSDIVFDGLAFTNSVNPGLGRTFFFGASRVGGAARITIRNCHIYGRSNGVFAMQGLKDLLVENNVIHDTGSHSIYLGSRDVPNSDLVVRNNVLYKTGSTCAQHNGRVTGYLLEGNVCRDFVNASGFSLEMGVSNSIVRNNVASQGQREALVIYDYPSPDQKNYPGLMAYDQVGNVIENNTFIIERGNAHPTIRVDLGSAEQTQDIGTNTFRNNTLANAAAYAPVWYSSTECGRNEGLDYCMRGSDPSIQAARSTWTGNTFISGFPNVIRFLNDRPTTGKPPRPAPALIDRSYTLDQVQAQLKGWSGNVKKK